MSNRCFVHYDFERITPCRATISIDHFNLIFVCPTCGNINIVSVSVTSCVDCTAVEVPVISCGKRDIGSSVHPSNQVNRVILTHIRDTLNSHDRITRHCDRIGDTSVGVAATRNIQNNGRAIDIAGRIIVHCQRALTEPRTTQERMFEAISEPFVGEQRGINRIAIKVADRSRHINLTAVANLVRVGGNIQSSNFGHFERGSRPYIDGVIAFGHTTGVGLGDLECKFVPQRIRQRVSQPRFSSPFNGDQRVKTT